MELQEEPRAKPHNLKIKEIYLPEYKVMPRISIAEAKKQGIRSGELHTILVPKSIPLKDAKQWLKSHGYKIRHRSTANFYRMNQLPEILGSQYATKILPNTGGIEFIFQYF